MSGLDKVKEELMNVIEKELQDYTDEVYREGYADGRESNDYNRPCWICKYNDDRDGCSRWKCEWERMKK